MFNSLEGPGPGASSAAALRRAAASTACPPAPTRPSGSIHIIITIIELIHYY